jgi:hypothetical protein
VKINGIEIQQVSFSAATARFLKAIARQSKNASFMTRRRSASSRQSEPLTIILRELSLMGKVLSFPSGVACKDCGEQYGARP